MESLYAQYIKERENRDIIEIDYGFLSYRIFEDECFICDIFVIPRLRKTGAVNYLTDEVTKIAKKAGCKYLAAKVYVTAPYASEGLLRNLHWGFKIHSVEKDVIVLTKAI